MGKFVKFIGCAVIGIVIFAMPILCSLSYVLNWADEAKFLLTVIAIALLVGLISLLYDFVE